MEEHKKVKIKEQAKFWGCKIEDAMSFKTHYDEYMTFKVMTYFLGSLVFLLMFISVLTV